MPIQIRLSDKIFSQYVRLRDKRCVRCLSAVELNDKGLPVSHQASHYFGRGRENTRIDPQNVDTLCMGCHRIWGSDDKEGYRQFKIRQLGQQGFDELQLRANQTKKKDEQMSRLVAKLFLKEVYKTA